MPFISWSVHMEPFPGKNEKPFNIWSNNHKKYLRDLKGILADKSSQKVVLNLTNTQDSRKLTDWKTQTMTKKS